MPARAWKERITALAELGKDEDADGIKAWLRSQYAETIRDRKRGALPEDFDLIGTEFHRWVRDHEERLGLEKSSDFVRFIDRDFAFYGYWYEQLRRAADHLTPGLECVYFNAEHNFTLQYPVLLSPLGVDDDDETIRRKLRVTAAFLDILIHRRIWNWRAIDYSTMQYAMFLVMRDIRGKAAEELAQLLRQRLDAETETFQSNESFRLHGMNGRQIHRLLARMTDFVETQSGLPSHYVEYARRGGKDGFEIEHIWADHPERHEDEFAHPSEFAEYRNRIGDLLLLPKSFNASLRRSAVRGQAGPLRQPEPAGPQPAASLPTSTTPASGASASGPACLSPRTRASVRQTSTTGRRSTASWSSTSGTPVASKRRPSGVIPRHGSDA